MSAEERTNKGISMPGLLDCPKCGHSNPVGTRYCDECGASLVDVMPRQSEDEAKGKRRQRGLLGRKDRAA